MVYSHNGPVVVEKRIQRRLSTLAQGLDLVGHDLNLIVYAGVDGMIGSSIRHLFCLPMLTFGMLLLQAYCGECTRNRGRTTYVKKGKGKALSMLEDPALPPPFKKCVVDGCGKPAGKNSMIHVFLGS